MSVIEGLWNSVCNAFLWDHRFLAVSGSMLLTWSVFWLPNLLLLALELTGRPSTLLQYKVQSRKNMNLSKSKLWTTVAVVIFNQVVVSVPFMVGLYHVMKWRGCGFSPQELPTLITALLHITIFVCIEEIGFYYSHRLFHTPALYKHVHKLHHEWTAPIGIVALYAHPVEHVVANLLPVVTGPVLLGSHLAVFWLWMTLVIISTTVHHSGYHFPFFISPQFHDFHHLRVQTPAPYSPKFCSEEQDLGIDEVSGAPVQEKLFLCAKELCGLNSSMVGQILRLVDSVRKGLFIVGSALLIFVAARNSITWHMQKFWGASGDFWQQQWNNIYQLCGCSAFSLGVFGTTVFGFLVFWLSNAFLLFLDITGRPAALLRYKVQADKNIPVPKGSIRQAVRLVLFNQLVVGIPVTVVVYWAMQWRGCSVMPEDLPTFHWAVLELIICILMEEIFFYYSHRLLHHPRLYKYIHKRHHEWTAPIGIVSIYAHPAEHILSNLIPPALGPLLLGSHLATAWLWFALALMSTTVAHCGYHFPFLPSPEAHDYHHLKFNQNYGVLGVLDRLHGTDNQFRASKAYQRHFLLLGFTPMSQQFPDQPSKSKLE